MTSYIIRSAILHDAEAIAEVHVRSWLETYAGLIPESYLQGLSIPERTKRWQGILGNPTLHVNTAHFVITENEQRVVGFGSCGQQRTDEVDCEIYDGEIRAIYILQSAQRQGLGRQLMSAMGRALRQFGFKGCAVWVLKENAPSRSFYEALGGKLIGEAQDKVAEFVVLNEVAYGWRDLTVLIE